MCCKHIHLSLPVFFNRSGICQQSACTLSCLSFGIWHDRRIIFGDTFLNEMAQRLELVFFYIENLTRYITQLSLILKKNEFTYHNWTADCKSIDLIYVEPPLPCSSEVHQMKNNFLFDIVSFGQSIM